VNGKASIIIGTVDCASSWMAETLGGTSATEQNAGGAIAVPQATWGSATSARVERRASAKYAFATVPVLVTTRGTEAPFVADTSAPDPVVFHRSLRHEEGAPDHGQAIAAASPSPDADTSAASSAMRAEKPIAV
jgi:hypothetical protein